jgi:transcriptional regulator with PAS, ATPase and Fis domain
MNKRITGISEEFMKALVRHSWPGNRLVSAIATTRSVSYATKGEPAMKARIDYTNVPEALRGMYQLEHYIHNSGLEESLVHLVKMRASQRSMR